MFTVYFMIAQSHNTEAIFTIFLHCIFIVFLSPLNFDSVQKKNIEIFLKIQVKNIIVFVVDMLSHGL